jgi:hypothetical protein
MNKDLIFLIAKMYAILFKMHKNIEYGVKTQKLRRP